MEPFERLDEAMSERRLRLRMNWRQVAEAAGISYTALRAIRRGDYRPTELTARAIEEALQWGHGSVAAIMGGGDPREAAASADMAGQAEREERPDLPQELALAQRLLAATVREMRLSPDEADEVWGRVRLEIEATHRSRRDVTGGNDRNDRAV